MNIRETKEFKLSEGFIMRNARPLDLAMWRYLFRGGSREDVLCALAAFQNPDGAHRCCGGEGCAAERRAPRSERLAR